MFLRILRSVSSQTLPCPHKSLALYSSRSHPLSAHSAPYPSRTHDCGALSANDVGSRVVLAGWLLPERKGKHMSFFPLKDSYGTTQLIVGHLEGRPDLAAALSDVPVESTVLIEGTVLLRPENARRPAPTGEIDVQVENFTLLNPAVDLPFLPSNPYNIANEDLRLRYRYLDLRRTSLSNNLKLRSQVTHIVRNVLHDQGFIEVETPVLLRSSPEGAREFIVPTRPNGSSSGEPAFYALQQSPQQSKQLLICSGGVDKYYQIAKCFRDEDGRKDRQPEFTQIDIEMGFVSWGNLPVPQMMDGWRIGGVEVRNITEKIIREVWHRVEGTALPDKFTVMTYHEAMSRYGSDKPDTRFGLHITDVTQFLPVEQQANLAETDEIIECFVVHQARDSGFIKASKSIDSEPNIEKIAFGPRNAATWLVESTLLNSFSGEMNAFDPPAINTALKLQFGDDIWLSRRSKRVRGGSTALGRLRVRLSDLSQERGDFINTKKPHFLWVTEFPLFTRADVEKEFLARGRWSSTHHPFTAPMWEDVDALYNQEAQVVRGQHYDLVLNGVEIGGGSVRIHDEAMQEHVFANILKLEDQEKAPFSHLLHALQCGAPPHGGIALGLDRMMAVLCGSRSIRDVIAFPKTSTGTDLLFRSPAPVKGEVLEQYDLLPRAKSG
ncbi:hypothetical protein APHAL10511_002157 [Amanita phalloides]|nr:hypothetical protein APHAL10511_002157 [Amanita phalloides]